jgi:hypothetical protein
MSNDSMFFEKIKQEGLVPLYEAKMIYHFDHRHATYEGATQANLREGSLPQPSTDQKSNPNYCVFSNYWVSKTKVDNRLRDWNKGWLISFRDIARASNERTAIFSFLPKVGVGHTAPLVFCHHTRPAIMAACFLSLTNSLTFDYLVRQKMGGTHLTYSILYQIPVVSPAHFSASDIVYITSRVLELVYTTWDMQPFTEDVWTEADRELREAIICCNANCNAGAPPEPFSPRGGFPLPPFRWNMQRRALIRAELDARIAKLYNLTRDELRYILDPQDVYGPDFPGETFRVLKEKEIKQLGEYRTRRLVLEAWDREGY